MAVVAGGNKVTTWDHSGPGQAVQTVGGGELGMALGCKLSDSTLQQNHCHVQNTVCNSLILLPPVVICWGELDILGDHNCTYG